MTTFPTSTLNTWVTTLIYSTSILSTWVTIPIFSTSTPSTWVTMTTFPTSTLNTWVTMLIFPTSTPSIWVTIPSMGVMWLMTGVTWLPTFFILEIISNKLYWLLPLSICISIRPDEKSWLLDVTLQSLSVRVKIGLFQRQSYIENKKVTILFDIKSINSP